ncbi:SDR family NAD(P)-dependent oxidoreductase [Actinoallomurus iriomotensis]|uniref:Beta-ketoacyl-ACP reductase n=1 Tax=Actinoallomurus iriomotensis TaxID=478107 RepID=A0A9W6W6A4_9ACTN|nr:SDR family oxidoreductase [Actinoallomurus iriomotensis]GLY91837.1 beta-ketoacyl-ACP reductase [Actinoallomurus iriomotensis]
MSDPFDLTGDTALVVGAAAGGLGARAALALGRRGARVLVADLPSRADDLDRTVDSLVSAGVSTEALTCDVADESSVADAVGHAGRLDVLVNAAGVMLRKPVAETTVEEFERVLRVNLTGAWLLGRAAGARMTAQGSGRIVNFATVYAERVGPVPESAYYSSKAGVANLTRSMASEFGTAGVRVNCLALGVFYPTNMTAPLADAPETLAWFSDRTLLKRLGDPETDLDGPLLLLASSAGSYVTGQVIYADGGWSAW